MPLYMDTNRHNTEAAMAVHCEAHGLIADDIIEVKEGF